MRRYAVALVLAAWEVAVLLDCDWSLAWLAALIPAVAWQAGAHANAYRRSW